MGHHFDDFRFIDMLTFCIALAAFILALVYNPQKEQFQGAVVPIGADENPLLYFTALALSPVTVDDGLETIPISAIETYVNPSGAFSLANNAVTFTPPSQNEYFYEVEFVSSFIPNAFDGFVYLAIGFGTPNNVNNSLAVPMDTSATIAVPVRLTTVYHSFPAINNSFYISCSSNSQGTITFNDGNITIKAIKGASL